MEGAGGRQFRVLELLGLRDGESCVVGGEIFADGVEVDSDTSLDQPRTVVWQVLDNHIPPSVFKEAVEGRGLVVLVDGIANFDNAAGSSAEQADLVAAGIFEKKPASGLSDGSIVSLLDGGIIQAVQRHDRQWRARLCAR